MENEEFGRCEDCNIPLAIGDTGKEYEYRNGCKTGRVKIIVGYLICPNCLQKYIVDDTFDGDWYYEN